MNNKYMQSLLVFGLLIICSFFSVASERTTDFNSEYGNVIDSYLLARLDRLGIDHHWADKAELIRRMSLDLTGEVADEHDRLALVDVNRAEMAFYFMSKPGYIKTSQLIYADILKYSDASMFSREEQIAGLNDLVARLHNGTIMYDEFARQVIMAPAFLSRFSSSVDRATVTMELFLGYTPITPYDFEYANMFNGYRLVDNGERIYAWDIECDNRRTRDIEETCIANIWGMTGENPIDAGRMLTSLPAFAEHGAIVLWRRYIGAEPESVLPELIAALGSHYFESGYDLRELTLQIVTSSAYAQSNKFREDDLIY